MALKDHFGTMGLFAVRDNNEIINLAEHFLELNSDAGTILTTTPLGGGASYTQAGQDRLNRSPVVNRVKGEVWADQAGTLYLEESENNSTWTATRAVAVSAGVTAQVPWTILTKRYFRFRYVNGATAQTGFILVQQTGGPGMRNAQLTGRKIQLQRSRQLLSTTVIAGGMHTLTFYASPGYIARVKYIGYFIPAIAGSTGTHNLRVTIGLDDAVDAERLLIVAGNGTVALMLRSSESAYSGLCEPIFTATVPLQVTYRNGTDLDQTGSRYFIVIYEEEAIA